MKRISEKTIKKALDVINAAKGHSHGMWYQGKFYGCNCRGCRALLKSGE